MNKLEILKHLKLKISNKLEGEDKVSKSKKKLYNELLNASENDISFRDCPTYFFAYMQCNSTGVGTSSFEGSTTQRTVALDYSTDQYLFFDGHQGAAQQGLEIFFLKQGETIQFYNKKQMEELATNYGYRLHLQQFRDLNFFLKSHRLNRYTAKITQGPFSYPIRPVFVAVISNEKPVFIGYLFEKDGHEYIIIDLDNTWESNEKKSGCSPWMFLGFLFPPVLVVAIIVMLYRILKE